MKKKVGVLGCVFSFLIPIVGVICYFVQKDRVENPKTYLWCALCGFILNYILLST